METSNTSENKSTIRNNQAFKFVVVLLIIGLTSVLVYSLRQFWTFDNYYKDNVLQYSNNISFKKGNLNYVIASFSTGILIAGSALTFGGLIGFVFGIPKRVINNQELSSAPNKYIGNDNLVEVSDWLTKIIVGVGLTQLTSIPRYLREFGEYAGEPLNGITKSSGEVAAESILTFFVICGFLFAYLWTRLYFAKLLEEAEKESNNKNV